MVKEKESAETGIEDLLSEVWELILYNDEVNEFEFVIESIIEVCGIEPIQAEQITLIAHEKGKCGVITGSFNELKPMYETLSHRGLTVSIE
ncbi:MAG TPA: ATP-dependent Clp protease adaptor ClpS [Lentimicrobium sp.]|nr:ATP-dependent Clp protease adaptor ClpS [Lentimicrobium sp.]